MARKAREKALYSTYKIEQTCSQTHFFNCDDERLYFLSCLKRTQMQYGFFLLGYRLDSSGYQLILYDNGIDITKIIRTLNIEYALKNARPQFKLKERFKSEIIQDSQELLNAIRILNRDQDCNPFNSYSIYCQDRDPVIDDSIALAIFSHNRETYTAFIRNQISLLSEAIPTQGIEPACSNGCIQSLEKGKEKLEELLQPHNLMAEDLKKHKSLRNDLIVYFRKNSILTLKEIGDMFSGMSESAISKIIRNHIEKP